MKEKHLLFGACLLSCQGCHCVLLVTWHRSLGFSYELVNFPHVSPFPHPLTLELNLEELHFLSLILLALYYEDE